MSLAHPAQRAAVLADLIPAATRSTSRTRDVLLVLSGTAFVALSALVAVPLPFTPVPLTMQTFAVLLVGAGLGWQRAVPSLLLYAAVGMAGVPWFARGESGVMFASFGYIVGFVVAAGVVGRLAAARGDRTVLRAVATMTLGSLIIYAFGVPVLMAVLDLDLAAAVALGVVPFLLGDAIKVALAAGLLPATWKLVDRR